jgi:uncharacterized YigZ family protein
MQNGYQIPSAAHRTEIVVVNSRFITTIGRAPTANDAKLFITSIRQEMPDASHHVYAFRAGYGNSVTEGMSDDGEPSGTAGPPVLAVLRGADIGDIVLVVTRYFGGTKLGTGGLVRAYTEAAQTGLSTLPTESKIPRQTVGIEMPYTLYERVKLLITRYSGVIDDEQFAGEITVIATFPAHEVAGFNAELVELSAGKLAVIPLS